MARILILLKLKKIFLNSVIFVNSLKMIRPYISLPLNSDRSAFLYDMGFFLLSFYRPMKGPPVFKKRKRYQFFYTMLWNLQNNATDVQSQHCTVRLTDTDRPRRSEGSCGVRKKCQKTFILAFEIKSCKTARTHIFFIAQFFYFLVQCVFSRWRLKSEFFLAIDQWCLLPSQPQNMFQFCSRMPTGL